MKKKLLCIILSMVLFFSITDTANAYIVENLPQYSNYNYYIASSCPTSALSAVSSAINTWNVPYPSLKFTLVSTSKSSYSFSYGDKVNTIGSSLSNSVFAQLGGSGAIAVNLLSISSGRIYESDIAFNNMHTYGNGNGNSSSPVYYDYQGVFTHELGHTFALGDVYTTNVSINDLPTMYGYNEYNGIITYYYFRTLSADDVSGKAKVISLRGF